MGALVLTIVVGFVIIIVLTTILRRLCNLIYQKFPVGYLTGSNLYPDYLDSLANLIKADKFFRNVENCQSRSYHELRCGISQILGGCEETKVINDPAESLRYILSKAVANILVGEVSEYIIIRYINIDVCYTY